MGGQELGIWGDGLGMCTYVFILRATATNTDGWHIRLAVHYITLPSDRRRGFAIIR